MLSLFLACVRGPLGGIEPPEPELRLYEVQYGDSLWGIATRYDVRGGWQRLAAMNRIARPTHIEAGWALKVPTSAEELPMWPTVRPQAAAPAACTGTPVGVGAPMTITGCEAAACIAVNSLDRICSCDRGEEQVLARYRGGQRLWSHTSSPGPSDWASGDDAEPSDLVATRYQLDGDAAPELLVAWRLEENDLGMSRWQVALFDEPLAAPAVFEVANYGVGTVAVGDGCELLATEWIYAREPARSTRGWYLTARRFTWNDGALRPTGDPVSARRLTYTFQPGEVKLGAARLGTPAADLTRAWSRSTDPVVELLRLVERKGPVTDAQVASARRLGDRATGLVFPAGYQPARSVVGGIATVATYQPSWWADPWSVLWL